MVAEPAIMIVMILIVVVFVFRQYKINYSSDDPQIQKLKDEAQWVIVGTIQNTTQKATSQGRGVINTTGTSYYDIVVETVERGLYTDNKMTVGIGRFSNFTPLEIYPPHLKKNYKKGERVRVFVNYDREENCYFTPALWYTIEPVQ